MRRVIDGVEYYATYEPTRFYTTPGGWNEPGWYLKELLTEDIGWNGDLACAGEIVMFCTRSFESAEEAFAYAAE